MTETAPLRRRRGKVGERFVVGADRWAGANRGCVCVREGGGSLEMQIGSFEFLLWAQL